MGYNSKYKSSEIEEILDSVGGKQDAITDLEEIRQGAAKGATAIQDISGKADDASVVHKTGNETISGAKTFNNGVNFLGNGDTNAVTLSTNTRINVNGTNQTVLGFGSGTFYINHGNYSLLLRGKDTRPKYNSTTLALSSDVDGKQDKVSGKGLSTEDFTTALKTKLEGLSNYDDTELSNAVETLRGDFDEIVSGDTTTAIKTFNEVIAFLDGIQDSQDLSSIIASIEQQIAGKMDKVTLATVATSGSYNDLSNKPTIPSEQVNADWNATSGKAQILNKPTIPAAVTESTVSGWGFTKNTGTYSKPSGGIPKTDLASDVQLSLSKANDALQEQLADEKYIKKNVWDDLVIAEADGIFSNEAGLHFALPNTNNGDEDDVLLSRESVKTINGESIFGSGDIDTRPYITNFSYEELQSIGNKQTSVQQELIEALREQRPILVPMSLTSDLGYYHASGYVEDLIYLTIYGDYGVVYYFEVDYTNSLELNPSNVIRKEFQNKLNSGTNIKTINGESILGSGDLTIESDAKIYEWFYGGESESVTLSQEEYDNIVEADLVIVKLGGVVSFTVSKTDKELSEAVGMYNLTGQFDLQGSKMYIQIVISIATKLATITLTQQEIPTKTSQLENDSNFITSNGLKTINGQSIVGSGDITISGGGGGTITGVSANGTSIATSGVANIPAASTSAYGVTKLSSATNSTSTSLAATASAVKAAYDLANNYKGTVTGVKVNGSTKTPSSGTVDIGNVVTSIKINGSTKTPSNGVVDLGTISGGGSSSGGSGAYAEVNHGTSDTTFTLTPNTFHVWDEVGALTLTLGSETAGVANEFLFQFTSGATATSLTLPDDIKWVNDAAPTISKNKIYQLSILNKIACAIVVTSINTISFYVGGVEFYAEEGMTWAEWCLSKYNTKQFLNYGSHIFTTYPYTGNIHVSPNSQITPNANYEISSSSGGGN